MGNITTQQCASWVMSILEEVKFLQSFKEVLSKFTSQIPSSNYNNLV